MAVYFNIPYIMSADPQQMEDFKPLFEKDWTNQLAEELKAFADEIVPEADSDHAASAAMGQSLLEEIFRLFIKEQTNPSGAEPNLQFEQIEAQADKAAAEVQAAKEEKEKKLDLVNNIASKFASVKEDYLNFLSEIDFTTRLEVTRLPILLVVENKMKQQAIEEKQKFEQEAQQTLQKELKRKLNSQELKTFKQQYAIKFGDPKIIGFNCSKNTDYLASVDQSWRRIIFELSKASYDFGKIKIETTKTKLNTQPADPNKKDPKPAEDKPAEKDFKDPLAALKATMNSINSNLQSSKDQINDDPDNIKKLASGLSLTDTDHYDKGYKMDDTYIDKSIPDPTADNSKDLRDESLHPEYLSDRFVIVLAYFADKLSFNKDFATAFDKRVFAASYKLMTDTLTDITEDEAKVTPSTKQALEISLNILFTLSKRQQHKEQLSADKLLELYLSFFNFVDQSSTSISDQKKLEYLLKLSFRICRLWFEQAKPQTMKHSELLQNVVSIYTNSKKLYPLHSYAWHLEAKELLFCSGMICNKSLSDIPEINKETMVKLIFDELLDISSKQPSYKLPIDSILIDSMLTIVILIGTTDKLKRIKGLEEAIKKLEVRTEFSMNENKLLQ